MSDALLDLRSAWRGIRRDSGLASALVVVLALGIGATTATFSVADALLLRPLSVSHPEQLVVIGDPARTNSTTTGGPRSDLISYPLYADVRAVVPQVTSVAASSRAGRIDVVIPDVATGAPSPVEHPNGRLVSANYFATLGVQAAIGRTFPVTVDGAPGDDPVIVVSYRYWVNRLGADRGVIGRTVTINHAPFTISGVMPRGFDGEIIGTPTAVWIPIMMEPTLIPARPWLGDRNTSSLLLIARLAPGATLAQARDAFNGVIHRTIRDHATAAEMSAQPARDPVPVSSGVRGVSAARAQYRLALTIMLIAVAALLLLATANAANLSLARALDAAPDAVVRSALGASPVRIMRQALVEHVMLGVCAGALGLALGVWGSTVLLRRANPTGDAFSLDLRINGRITIVTTLVSLLVVLGFGLVPIVSRMHTDPAQALRGSGRGVVRGGSRGARVLVAAQVALSVLLIAATAMLQRSLARIEGIDAGFQRDRIVVSTVDLARTGITLADRPAAMRRLLERIRSANGVTAASYSVNGMYAGAEADTTLQVEGYSVRAAQDTIVKCDYVGPGFFNAIGARLLQGRDIAESDDQNAPHVAVVNQDFARFFFGGANAVGRRLQLGTNAYEIVGVVADIQSQQLREPVERRIYTPVAQRFAPPGYITFAALGGSAQHIAEPVRQALLAEMPSLVILSTQPVDQIVAGTLVQDRLLADVVTFFGVLALFLAGLGVYGVVANATARRIREFGIRLALGAQPSGVLVMVLRDALRLVAVGGLVGVALVLGAAPLLRRQLYGVAAIDLASVLTAIVVIAAAASAAALLPALRAARVEPVVALQHD